MEDLWRDQEELSFDTQQIRQQDELAALDELDFSDEIPIPSDCGRATATSQPIDQVAETASPGNATDGWRGHDRDSQLPSRDNDDAHVADDRKRSSESETTGAGLAATNHTTDSQVPFDRAVYESCSIALGVPCYRNPVYGPCSDRTDVACRRLAERFPQVWEFIRTEDVALLYYVPLDAYDFHCACRIARDDCQPRVMRAERNGNDGLIGALRVSDERIVADLYGPAVLYQRRIVVCTYERDTIPNHQFLYIVRMSKPKINDRSS